MHLAYAEKVLSLNFYHGTSYTDFGSEMKVKLPSAYVIFKPT
jgi:hypothetical protein